MSAGPLHCTCVKCGPCLGGIVDMPALFTVDTCGETGALGFSIGNHANTLHNNRFYINRDVHCTLCTAALIFPGYRIAVV